MASPRQLALRNAIGEALYAADSDAAGPRDKIFPRLVHDAENGKLPDDPRDWFGLQLKYELQNLRPQAVAKCELLERSDELVAAARLGPADLAAMLSRAGAPEPANSADVAQLAARCLILAMSHHREMRIDAFWEPYNELLRQAREAQRKLRQLMPSLIALWKRRGAGEDMLRVLDYQRFAEELEKVEFNEPGGSVGIGRRVWEPGARELAGVYRDIVNPNAGWSRNGPAVRFLVEALRRVYPGTNPTAAAIESLLARRGPSSRVTHLTQSVLDRLLR